MFPKRSKCQHCRIKWYSCFLRRLTGQFLKYELQPFKCLSYYDNAKDFSHNFNINPREREHLRSVLRFSLHKISGLGPQQVIFSGIVTVLAFLDHMVLCTVDAWLRCRYNTVLCDSVAIPDSLILMLHNYSFSLLELVI